MRRCTQIYFACVAAVLNFDSETLVRPALRLAYEIIRNRVAGRVREGLSSDWRVILPAEWISIDKIFPYKASDCRSILDHFCCAVFQLVVHGLASWGVMRNRVLSYTRAARSLSTDQLQCPWCCVLKGKGSAGWSKPAEVQSQVDCLVACVRQFFLQNVRACLANLICSKSNWRASSFVNNRIVVGKSHPGRQAYRCSTFC